MPIPKICLWRYFPIDHANRVVKLEPYRTKKECQALGDPWDGIHGAVLREILIEDETAYKLLPSERVDPRGGFKGGVRPQSPTRQISISDSAVQELKRRLENGEGQCMSEILSKLILTTPLDLQITPKRSRYGHSTRVSVDAHAHLMKILNRYKLRGNKSGFTVLAIVDEILCLSAQID